MLAVYNRLYHMGSNSYYLVLLLPAVVVVVVVCYTQHSASLCACSSVGVDISVLFFSVNSS
jgi:hypothetical protein